MASYQDPRRDPDAAIERGPAFGFFERKSQFAPRMAVVHYFAHLLRVETQLRNREQPIGIDPRVLTADRTFHSLAPFRRKMRYLIQAQVTPPCPIAQIQSRHDVEKPHEPGGFVPWITDKPFVRAFASQDDFLTIGMNALGKFEQGAASGVDHRSFSGFNEPGITFECFQIAIVLDNGWLRSDVPRRETRCTQFIKLRLIHPHRVSVDCRTLETTSKGEDHARIHTARQIRSNRDIRAQSFLDGLRKKPLEFIHQRTRIISPFLFTLGRKIHFPIGAFGNDRTRARTSRRNAEAVSWWQELNTFETGPRSRHGGEGEHVIESPAIGSRWNHS